MAAPDEPTNGAAPATGEGGGAGPPNEASPQWDPAIITAALAALRRGGQQELGLLIAKPADAEPIERLPQITLGFSVDTRTGEVQPPPANDWPVAGRPFVCSARLVLDFSPPGGDLTAEGVMEQLGSLTAWLHDATGKGWRIELAPRLRPQLDLSVPAIHGRPGDLPPVRPQPARPARSQARPDGRGTMIGIVDRGLGLAHSAFRNPDGTTRLLLLWDQNGPPPAGPGPIPHAAALAGYGREFGRAALDAALSTPDPYWALAYQPESNPWELPAAGQQAPVVHGTHVLGVAAGRGGPDAGSPGIAPGADLAFVHLRRPPGPASAAWASDVLDGVLRLFQVAGNRPAVVNLSLNYGGGPHDGTSLLEVALDALLTMPGRVVTVAAGNERMACRHASGALGLGGARSLRWNFAQGDPTSNELSLFYETQAPNPLLDWAVFGPDGGRLGQLPAGPPDSFWLVRGGQVIGSVAVSRQPPGTAWLHHIEVSLTPSGAAETFRLELTHNAPAADQVWFDAWIRRDDRETGSQSAFAAADADPACTLGSMATGQHTLVVGAYDHLPPVQAPPPFSAEGPTRIGLRKPDVAAPGLWVRATAARGGQPYANGQPGQQPLQVRMSGTSVAAPHAAGLAALALETRPNLAAAAVTNAIRTSTQAWPSPPPKGEWHPQLGFGRIDVGATLRNLP